MNLPHQDYRPVSLVTQDQKVFALANGLGIPSSQLQRATPCQVVLLEALQAMRSRDRQGSKRLFSNTYHATDIRVGGVGKESYLVMGHTDNRLGMKVRASRENTPYPDEGVCLTRVPVMHLVPPPFPPRPPTPSPVPPPLKKPEGPPGWLPPRQLPGESQDFHRIRTNEKKRLYDFFGKGFDIPQLPEGVTMELVEFWKKNDFALEYWPLMLVKEDWKIPGVKHKFVKVPPGGVGVDFYSQIGRMQAIQENSTGLATVPYHMIELPNAWVLRDMHEVYEGEEGNMENDDVLMDAMKSSMRQLTTSMRPKRASRAGCDPALFNSLPFWITVQKALRVDTMPGVTARLPRAIEAHILYQDQDLFRRQWCQEYEKSQHRLVIQRNTQSDNVLDSQKLADANISFNPLIVFPKRANELAS
jgi:hypothetical protein